MPVITISRQFGAGGHTLGETLAKRLGYQLIDHALLEEAAKTANASTQWAESAHKEPGGLIMRFVSGLVSRNFLDWLISGRSVDAEDRKFYDFLRIIISLIGQEGDAVIVGGGSQFALPDQPQILKILLVADYEDRINFVMKQYSLPRNKVEQLVRREEKKRIALLKKFRDVNPDAPSLYSLTINTSRISLEQAETLIIAYINHVIDENATPIWQVPAKFSGFALNIFYFYGRSTASNDISG